VNNKESNQLFLTLKSKLSSLYLSIKEDVDQIQIEVSLEKFKDLANLLFLDSELDFKMLLNVTAVDFLDLEFLERSSHTRFEVVYHFLSITHKNRLRVKVSVEETNLKIETITDIYKSAEFLEREVYDMYGIEFLNHPDLRRVLMYPEFKGFPLRKDYPVQGKQPRIELRHPEVSNSARLMKRDELVNINSKDKE